MHTARERRNDNLKCDWLVRCTEHRLERININKIPGLSAYKLSHIVSHLKFFKPSLRYPNRVDRTKSNVLRALCDRYPNVWAGLPEIADKAKCSTSQARRALRELEFKDRLIVDVNSRLTWRRDENGRSITGAPKQPQGPPPMIEEPIMGLTNHKNPPPHLPPSAEKSFEERLGDSYAKH